MTGIEGYGILRSMVLYWHVSGLSGENPRARCTASDPQGLAELGHGVNGHRLTTTSGVGKS